LTHALVDVVKSRIQNAVVLPGEKPKYGWTYPAIVTIAKEEGVGALYKGFIPKVRLRVFNVSSCP
jgi:solute carrier family 25 2-oxodicarboxylate transporter 21